ncbi:molybdopterin-guanine dinucleotide biosynthesis protein A [Salinisphaera sp. C84B14]|uniref:molybdenum cofactor guanylyltransferase MobA n=1 Tax=Salinisphaera sp. C84B14 TaxID=1304155 RepID=UPI0033414978
MKIDRSQITAGVLAGGAGRRLGGIDKGWYVLEGRALVEHTLARLQPQTGSLLISANRSLARYRGLGCEVVRDRQPGHGGPLQGLASLLHAASTPYLLVVPVDTPALPDDLGQRLAAAMTPGIDLVCARAAGRRQPLHALMHRRVLAALEEALAAGTARVTDWQARLAVAEVDWPQAQAFANINAPGDARAWQDTRSIAASFHRHE